MVRWVGLRMTDILPGGKRRIDRILSEDYLSDLRKLSLRVVGAKRREAEQEEAELAYLLRLLHARIDTVQAEQVRRTGKAAQVASDTVRASSDGQSSGRFLRRTRHSSADSTRSDARRRRVERLVSDVDLTDVNARTDDELARVLNTYQAEERRVSDARVLVQAVLDRCTAELARRGHDDNDHVLEEASAGGGDEKNRKRPHG